MCTVTFLARQRGYLLGMNRDEQLTRATGLPPRPQIVEGRTVVGPSEPGGGTWIALNDAGVTYALINWYSIKSRPIRGKTASRGAVVNSVRAQITPAAAAERLAKLPLKQMRPFRLIGVFSETREIFEWQWDWERLVSKAHPWRARQFISSGWDEPAAQRIRSENLSVRAAAENRWPAGLAAAFACLARAGGRPVFHLHAPRRCGDGELHGSEGIRPCLRPGLPSRRSLPERRLRFAPSWSARAHPQCPPCAFAAKNSGFAPTASLNWRVKASNRCLRPAAGPYCSKKESGVAGGRNHRRRRSSMVRSR